MNLNRYSESSAQPGLSVSKVLALPVAVPPTKTEQEAIAKALSDADSYIESLEQLIAKKRAIMQGAMQELLTGKRRLPGFLTGWETKQLGSVVAIEKGQLVTSSTVSDGSVPVIAGGKRPAYYHAIANRPAHTITISASGANAGYVAFHKRPIFASDCSTVTSGLGYSVEFIYYVLRFRQQDIYSRQAGGAQPHIHPSDLSPLIVSLPKVIDEQRAIAAVLSDMDAELAEQNKTLVKAGNIKQGMMQSLLTGKVRLV